MAGRERKVGEGGMPRVEPTRLPLMGRDFIGRDEDLAWLDACWANGVHVASIIAWGGVGKTALVNRWRNTMCDAGWRGAEQVYDWSFYRHGTGDSGGASADEFMTAALRWFGDSAPTEGLPWDKGVRLAELVRKQRTLLILDGMEALQAAPGQGAGAIKDPALQALVRGLAEGNAGLCVITSRIAVVDLASLAGVRIEKTELTRLSAEAGARLLELRGAKGTPEELREAAEEYQGHCLALTLLGSYLRTACRGDIRKRNEIPPLQNEQEHGAQARRMLSAYERWFEGKSEGVILRMLGLFDRPASEHEIDALRAVPVIPGLTDTLADLPTSEWNQALTSLRDVGLLVAVASDTGPEELDAHPLVREHFGAQVKNNSLDAWRAGHGRLYDHLESTAKPLPGTDDEMAPLLSAVVHGCRAERYQEAIDLYWSRIQRAGRDFNWNRLGAFASEAIVLAAFFNPPWNHLATALHEGDRTKILNAAGFRLRALGRLPDAHKLMKEALQMRVDEQNWQDAAREGGNLSDLELARGDLDAALTTARESFGYACTADDLVQRMTKKATEGAVLQQMGKRDEASACFAESLGIGANMVSAKDLGLSMFSYRLCDFLLDENRFAEVVANADEALAIFNLEGRLVAAGLAQLSLGRAHLALGTFIETPAGLLDDAVKNVRNSNRQDYLAGVLVARADLHRRSAKPSEARRDLDEALSSATRGGFRLHEVDARLGLGRLLLAEANPISARDQLALARKIIDRTGYHRRDAELAALEARAATMAAASEAVLPQVTPPGSSGDARPTASRSERTLPSSSDTAPRAEAVPRESLVDALSRLLPAQLEKLIFKLEAPMEYLSGAQAPPATRSIEVLRWAEQANRLPDVERLLAEVTSVAKVAR
jgi:tetratricopeptide (TPR) repeat protein